MREPIYNWDNETKTATYTLWDRDGNKHTGIATCHPEDMDMANEKTGLEIAQRRAEISSYKMFKYKVKNELGALKQLYYSIKHSSKFNPTGYESNMLYRQIKLKEEDLETVNNIIDEEKIKLKVYIAEKDALYKQLRKIRNKNKA